GGSGFRVACVLTNALGEYTVSGLASGSYKVEFSQRSGRGYYLAQDYNGKSSSSEADAVSVTAGSTSRSIDAALQPGGQITGRVTDASTQAALANFEVCVFEAGGSGFGVGCGRTNSRGEYT